MNILEQDKFLQSKGIDSNKRYESKEMFDKCNKLIFEEETRRKNQIKKYCNYHMYTDIFPYEVINVISEQTVEIRSMKAELDPTWKPDFSVGGFFGHTHNNRSQRYNFKSDPDGKVIRVRWSKANRKWQKGKYMTFIMNDSPERFYDFNF